MTGHYAHVAFTPLVREHQRAHGSERSYDRMAQVPDVADSIGPDEAAFITERDSFYLATVSETGWPYIQHRGGAPGFLRVIDEHTLGFADFRGNKQYISRGNLEHDSRVALFLMDYATQSRMKIFGRARVIEDDPDLVRALEVDGYRAQSERAVLIDVEAFDWNCRQHIPPLYPRAAVAEAMSSMRDRISELEGEIARLKGEVTA
ncbi:pyridoxamine 5'-phosphate oxidase family protein [Nocardia camponoti]|uniref:Pyridoxamine 5'-phosphate oxidase n=1 Tax=Nocardia camponoti TaxID=1616106 RepID=A0A917VCJ9_9NOCA|nr:pyridoxamine 5'-phosphate oxidase family protein [Nocardia camponoti]GGK64307.1 pyridoxamine 5'-phosphate oxidase [Nocardia camponoti]